MLATPASEQRLPPANGLRSPWPCDTFPMRETPFPDPPGPQSASRAEASKAGRLTSLVHVMNGRRSPISHLGVLDLHAGTLSLWDAKGKLLFAVPAETAQARPARRRSFEMRQSGFEVHADDRWWCLVAHTTPAKYQRRSTRELIKQYGACELVPRPGGMRKEAYLRATRSPTQHQTLWGIYWRQVLQAVASRKRLGRLRLVANPGPVRRTLGSQRDCQVNDVKEKG